MQSLKVKMLKFVRKTKTFKRIKYLEAMKDCYRLIKEAKWNEDNSLVDAYEEKYNELLYKYRKAKGYKEELLESMVKSYSLNKEKLDREYKDEDILIEFNHFVIKTLEENIKENK